MKQRADIAILSIGDETRLMCVGCADILEGAGMLVVERAFTFGVENIRIKIYSIASGYTPLINAKSLLSRFISRGIAILLTYTSCINKPTGLSVMPFVFLAAYFCFGSDGESSLRSSRALVFSLRLECL
jgi:hypothetical protein